MTSPEASSEFVRIPANHPFADLLRDLQQRSASELPQRTRNNPHFTEAEIAKVQSLRRSLFPKGFVLSKEATETFRALAKFAPVELRPAAEIRSHRRFVGPVIVFLKRLTWPFIKLHLKDTVAGLREFNSRTVVELARQHAALEELRTKR